MHVPVGMYRNVLVLITAILYKTHLGEDWLQKVSVLLILETPWDMGQCK